MEKPRSYTRTEAAIQEFIENYGADALVSWLGVYSKNISQKDYHTYHRIKMAACKEFNIPVADISGDVIMKHEAKEAMMIISYLTHRHSRLSHKHISKLQNLVVRTIYNHINKVSFWVENPNTTTSDFIKKYNNIIHSLGYDQQT